MVNGEVGDRVSITQQKINKTVTDHLIEHTRVLVQEYITKNSLQSWGFLFPSKIKLSSHITGNRYRALVKEWVALANLDPARYGSHVSQTFKVKFDLICPILEI